MVDQCMIAAFERSDTLPGGEPAFLVRLRLRAQRRVLWMRALWTRNDVQSTQGLAITDSDVDRVLEDSREIFAAEAEFYRSNDAARVLAVQIDEADARAACDAPWRKLATEFGLSQQETDLLQFVVAVEIDPWWRRVC